MTAPQSAVSSRFDGPRSRLRRTLDEPPGAEAAHCLLLGADPRIRALRALCPELAVWRGTIVVLGGTGSGKMVLVDEIRRHLPPLTPYIRVAATVARHSLLHTDFFGYMKGAFTGAAKDQRALLEVLNEGVLFLDDVQDLTDEFQYYLVDIADGKPFRPLGAIEPITPNLRLIIVGTQQPLATLYQSGHLREDLYERLNGVTVELPPLRARAEDIPMLAAALLKRLAERQQRQVPAITPAALAVLQRHDWPRNVRELEKTLERVAFWAWVERRDQPVIEVRHLAADGFAELAKGSARPKDTAATEASGSQLARPGEPDAPASGTTRRRYRSCGELSTKDIETAVRRYGSVAAAARALGVALRSLWTRIRASETLSEQQKNG